MLGPFFVETTKVTCLLKNCNRRRACSPPLFYSVARYAPERWPSIRQNGGPVWSRIFSGIPNIDFYYITDGNVEISYDGSTYVKAGNFVEGKCIIYPKEKIKAVKINITASNDGHILCLQDLRIE